MIFTTTKNLANNAKHSPWSTTSVCRKSRLWFFGLLSIIALAGCNGSYVAPNTGPVNPINFADMERAVNTDESGEAVSDGHSADFEPAAALVPNATFPARVAFARIQTPNAAARREGCVGQGQFCVVSNRRLETQESMERLLALPQLIDIAPINSLLISSEQNTERQLRQAASLLQAELLFLYSMDTRFQVASQDIGPLDLVTLGYAPNKKALANSTASAALYDTSTGYIYALFEATASADKRATSWSINDAKENAARESESKAFDALIENIELRWPYLIQEYWAD